LANPLQATYVVYVRIGDPARRHKVADAHLARHAHSGESCRHGLTMLFGPASDGALLEIGVLDIEGDDPVIIHAMALRSKFYRFLGSGGDHHATHRR